MPVSLQIMLLFTLLPAVSASSFSSSVLFTFRLFGARLLPSASAVSNSWPINTDLFLLSSY